MANTTQRAYTLRLKPLPGAADQDWSKFLWKTHEAVNKGAKAFGDWLLTFRGGISHELADDPDLTIDERRDRRILLALSWLSVESKAGAPAEFVVSHDLRDNRSIWHTVEALSVILRGRGVGATAAASWIDDCKASLEAKIRSDAVWVNRSAAFDAAVKDIGGDLTHEVIWDFLSRFLGDAKSYLRSFSSTSPTEEGVAPQRPEAKDFVIKAGRWLSSRFGSGPGADFQLKARVYRKIAEWAERNKLNEPSDVGALARELRQAFGAQTKTSEEEGVGYIVELSSYTGHTPNPVHEILRSNTSLSRTQLEDIETKALAREQKCKANIGSKGRRQYSDAILGDVERRCGLTYLQEGSSSRHKEFSVMLDHAARNVSGANSWIRRAEESRRQFIEDAKRITNVPEPARAWLDRYSERRALDSGSIEPYLIRRRALGGWKEVVKAWDKKACRTADDRETAAKQLQDDPEIKKFGDIQLFTALAAAHAIVVWKPDGKADPEILENYVKAINAEHNKRRFKVPAYRHPDALRHPVFVDFGNSRWTIAFGVHEAAKKAAKGKPAVEEHRHGVSLTLFDGGSVRPIELRWESKRLANDLAFHSNSAGVHPVDVSRNDRLGRAAAHALSADLAAIIGVFADADWNGRLQAPRADLDGIAKLKNQALDEEEKLRRIQRIKWTITFSPKLRPQGPWHEYARTQGLNALKAPFAMENKSRKGRARLTLSRLPNLRVLSVDLGHRFAAACAVWETLSTAQMNEFCRAAACAPPGQTDIYFSIKRGKGATVFRRIGPDMLNGEPHPAPWARLDRQFLIKLQGEERDARKASDEERVLVAAMDEAIGRTRGDEALPKRVDKLMAEAMNSARLGLKRHGDHARIAYNLTTDKRLIPGGGAEELDENERVKLMVDTLVLWRDLFAWPKWADTWAKQLWEQHIGRFVDEMELPALAEEAASASRKQAKEELKLKLLPAAQSLAADKPLRHLLNTTWLNRWQEDGRKWRGLLRRLHDWVLPRGSAAGDASIRHVGGLSLDRIATIQAVYRLQKAYATRPDPTDLRKRVPEHGDESLEGFGWKTLQALDRLRENRVKQVASRIVEAALGVGRFNQPTGAKKDIKRPREPVDQPCHAVVIESLSNYRPEEMRTRRENRQLMSWSAGKVQKYLQDGCSLNGLFLWEAWPAYTSRQDSRTGAPGIRCTDILADDFRNPRPYLAKRLKRAKEAAGTGQATVEQYLVDLEKTYAADPFLAKPARIPDRGGDIFVSSRSDSPAAKGLQADLNAAANIGLRALTDPDWPGAWWHIPCDTKSFKPLKDKVGGAACIDCDRPLVRWDGTENPKKEIINLWRDPSTPSIISSSWQRYDRYWQEVQATVITVLRKQALK